MKPGKKISLKEARHIILSSQKLSIVDKTESKEDLYKTIQQLGYIQIDTISVVERSHHHTLWSRMPSYKKSMLHDLLEKDKRIFEYWSHAAAFLPMKDFKFSLIRKMNFSKKYQMWGSAGKRIINKVYDRVKAEGPLQSKDFEDRRQRSTGWWDWKPSKDALDYLFHTGRLMVVRRQGFQKVYDLTERVLPQSIDVDIPSEIEFYQHLILASIISNGLSSQREIMYLRKYDRKLFEKSIWNLIEDGKITGITIDGMENEKYFTLTEKLDLLNTKKKINSLHILSPFDNLVIQRKRLKTFFNFDYQLECYVPQSKRKYGYFCLPVLSGDSFIGKIDLKAFRSTGSLMINNFYKEERVNFNTRLQNKFRKKMEELARFTGCSKVTGLEIVS